MSIENLIFSKQFNIYYLNKRMQLNLDQIYYLFSCVTKIKCCKKKEMEDSEETASDRIQL